jgi:phosphatidylglycerol---prolipoprotein diacylglyceryl transferase
MFPLLLSIGPFHLYSISACIVLSWLSFSFLFWRHLRGNGVDDEKIFDITFWTTIWSAIISRIVFVILHWDIFDGAWLKVPAIWVAPGFSLYGAFIGALVTFIVLSKVKRIRLGYILDALSVSFPASIAIALFGVLLDGSVPGIRSTVPWAIRYVGSIGTRHPVQIYEILTLIVITLLISFISKRSLKEKWPFGALGVWFLLLFTVPMFILEFFKDTHVYWISLRANQWILLAIFAESMGAFYVRCGGRERVRPVIHSIQTRFTKLVGGIYAKFSK